MKYGKLKLLVKNYMFELNTQPSKYFREGIVKAQTEKNSVDKIRLELVCKYNISLA